MRLQTLYSFLLKSLPNLLSSLVSEMVLVKWLASLVRMDGLTAPTPHPHLEDLPGTFAILTTVSVLASFMSTWDKLEAFGKREPKLRKCLWARLPFILFTDDWCRWAHLQGMVPLWAGGPRYYKISSWTNLEEQAREDNFCINSCLHVLALSFFV